LQTISKGKAELLRLEDSILKRLVESEVNLLEDVELVNTLGISKETSATVYSDIELAEITMRRINDQREVYRNCGRKAAALFFVLSDLSKIDPMYQFSLSWYKKLFEESITSSKETVSQDRQDTIMKVHKLNVYNRAC
jgi:dynein heavy chain